MSYDQLPTELKRLVVGYVDQADKSYRRRRETEARRMFRPFIGKGMASFSRVNAECRQLALPYILTTLRASKAKHRTFEERILNTSAMSLITTFILDINAQHANLSSTVLYILPHLPNLRRIVFPHDIFLTSISTMFVSAAEIAAISFTVSKLVQIAQKIIEWDVQLSEGLDYESIVFANPSVIRSLTAKSLSDVDLPLLGSEETTFSRQLARCSSLETLKLNLHNSPDVESYQLCHSDSLSRPYLFRQTLTSLELSVTYGIGPTPEPDDASLVSFAASFPNLRHLRLLGVDYFPGSPILSFTFPHLVNLELLRMAEFDNVAMFLKDQIFPKLERVEVGIVADFNLDLDVSTTDSFHLVAWALNRSKSTLKSFHINHNRGITELEMQRFKAMVECEVRGGQEAEKLGMPRSRFRKLTKRRRLCMECRWQSRVFRRGQLN